MWRALAGIGIAVMLPLANGMRAMSFHWIYAIGSKACAWSGALAAHVWPQTPCNGVETWNMGAIVVSALGVVAVFAVYRRLDAWHNRYRRSDI